MEMKVKPACFCLKSSVLNALVAQLSHTGCSLSVHVSFSGGGDLVRGGGRNSPLDVSPIIMAIRQDRNSPECLTPLMTK